MDGRIPGHDSLDERPLEEALMWVEAAWHERNAAAFARVEAEERSAA
jgi:hypothetical protein